MRADQRYLQEVSDRLAQLAGSDDPAREAVASCIADCFESGGLLHVFGTGHSHLLALELFYRAGGFPQVNPILFEELMLHRSASGSTERERDSTMLDAIRAQVTFGEHDCLLVISNSGGNDVCVGLARDARAAGLPVIALTSLQTAQSSHARASGLKLHQVADLVLDNLGVEGDAAIELADGSRVGPTSTALGAIILNSVMARVAELLLERGVAPEIFASSNMRDGDIRNGALVRKYAPRVGAL
jgi:uncharacterized phosphosugar-binding protein